MRSVRGVLCKKLLSCHFGLAFEFLILGELLCETEGRQRQLLRALVS